MMLGDSGKYFKALADNGLTDKFWVSIILYWQMLVMRRIFYSSMSLWLILHLWMILAEYKKHNPCIAFYNTNNIKKNNMFIVNVRNARLNCYCKQKVRLKILVKILQLWYYQYMTKVSTAKFRWHFFVLLWHNYWKQR